MTPCSEPGPLRHLVTCRERRGAFRRDRPGARSGTRPSDHYEPTVRSASPIERRVECELGRGLRAGGAGAASTSKSPGMAFAGRTWVILKGKFISTLLLFQAPNSELDRVCRPACWRRSGFQPIASSRPVAVRSGGPPTKASCYHCGVALHLDDAYGEFVADLAGELDPASVGRKLFADQEGLSAKEERSALLCLRDSGRRRVQLQRSTGWTLFAPACQGSRGGLFSVGHESERQLF